MMTWPPEDRFGAGQQGSRPGAWSPQDDAPGRRADGPFDDAPWSAGPPPIPTYQPSSPTQAEGMQRHAPPPPPAGTRYADWGERVGAGLVDGGILLATLLVVGTLGDISDTLGGLGALAWFGLAGWMAWLNGSKGQSPGKAVMGLKVVRDADRSTLGGPVGLVRSGILWIVGPVTAGLFVVLSVLWPLWDRKNRTLHDAIVSASVLAGYPRAKFGKEIFRP